MKIVCLGDSLTFGYGVNASQSWCHLSKLKTGADFVNKGVNGNTTGDMHGRFAKDVIQEKPDGLCLIGGTNDILLNETMESIHCNIAAMVQWALKENIVPFLGIPITVHMPLKSVGFIEADEYSKVNQTLSILRDWILQYAKVTQVAVIDLYRLYEEEMKNYQHESERCDVAEAFYVDGVHPNPKGHEIISRIICEEVTSVPSGW